MAEEISSKLGFEVSEAIAALKALTKELKKYEASVEGSAAGSKKANRDLSITDKVLKELSKSAANAGDRVGEFSKRVKADFAKASAAARAGADDIRRSMRVISARINEDVGRGVGIGNIDRRGGAGTNPLGRFVDDARLAQQIERQRATRLTPQGQPSNVDLARFDKNVVDARRARDIERVNAVTRDLRKEVSTLSPVLDKTSKSFAGLGSQAISVAKGFLLFRGVSLIASAFTDAGKRAIELEKRIGAIQTISEDFRKQSVGSISDTVTGLANQFGQSSIDTATALYDALSNQIGTAAESTRFLTDALQLGSGALISTTDSGNLLAGVIKAYGLSAANAADISNKFFKTIDVGRVTGADLADTFGRITPLAAAMGISIEEVLSGVATLTIQGVRADDALTQLTNVMVRLAKPAGALRSRLDDLGFANAEVAIAATGGLVPALKLIIANTDGSTTAISRLFPNIRALRGVIGLLKDDALLFAQNLEAISTAADGTAKAASQIILNTAGGRVSKAFESFKNKAVSAAEVAIQKFVEFSDVVVTAEHSLLDFLKFRLSKGILSGFFVPDAPTGQPTQKIELSVLRQQLDTEAELQAEGLTDRINQRKKFIEDVVAGNLEGQAKERQGTLQQLTQTTQAYATHFRLRGLTVQNFVDNAQSHIERLQQEITDLRSARTDFSQGARAGQFERSLKGLSSEDEATQRAIRTSKLLDRVQQLSGAGDVQGARKAAEEALQQAARFAELTGSEALVNKVIKSQSASTDTLINQDQALVDSATRLLQIYTDQAVKQNEQVEIKRELLNLTDLERAAPAARADQQFSAIALKSSLDTLATLEPKLNTLLKEIETKLAGGIESGDQAQVSSATQQLLALKKELATTNSEAAEAAQLVLDRTKDLVKARQGVLTAITQSVAAEGGISLLLDDQIEKTKQLNALKAAGAGKATQNEAFGGMIHRADGGFAPRGTDTVPAMLSPGEFVVNAKSARRFYSQLVAINRGAAPQYRAEGGSVTNVGDISINVNGSASAEATARAVQKQLRREFRRSTSRR